MIRRSLPEERGEVAPSSAEWGIHPIVYVQAPLRWEDKPLIRNVTEKHAPPEAELKTSGASGWEVAGIYTDAPLVDMDLKRSA